MANYRGFYWLSQAWYGPANLQGADYLDEINIGLYSEDGGTDGEFCIRWIDLTGRRVPLLRAFHDSWAALWEFRDFLEELAKVDDDECSPEEIVSILESCGFTDSTPRKTEEAAKPCPCCGRRP